MDIDEEIKMLEEQYELYRKSPRKHKMPDLIRLSILKQEKNKREHL